MTTGQRLRQVIEVRSAVAADLPAAHRVAARALYEGAGSVRHREFTHLDQRFCIYMRQVPG